MQSPFVYTFVDKILNGPKTEIGERIEARRREWLKRTDELILQDFGAGYDGDGRASRRVTLGAVTRSSARRRYAGELLYRIAAAYRPKKLIELGTNLGFSALYQALAVPEADFITIEGDATLCKLAEENFKDFGLNLKLINAQFEDALPEVLNEQSKFNWAFIDGRHEYEATIRYFETIIPYCAPEAIIILDDINWSSGMKNAWHTLCARPEVSISIDLFDIGLLFLYRKQAKEHFVIWRAFYRDYF